MPETNISSATASDLTTQVKDYSVDTATTDGPAEQKETFYTNEEWPQQLGYYEAIPEIHAVVDAKAAWTMGKGYTADEGTTLILDRVKGFGKDTFNSILENDIRVYQIGGGSYNEIITDDRGVLTNLKVLDPGSMRNVANRKGIIIRFEQLSKTGDKKKVVRKFEPDKIFYLPRNRLADTIHGESMIPALVKIILAKNEAMDDWKRVLHRNIDPLWIFHLDTDDTTKIAAFKRKHDKARGKGENMYIPKGAIVPELVSVATNATLNPLAWIESLDDKFYQAAGVPKIILGGTGAITEAAVKIAYLAYQQTIEEEQLFIEEQVLSQLNLEIKLTFPASLENEMLSDKPKEEEGVETPEIETEKKAIETNDMTTEMEGRK